MDLAAARSGDAAAVARERARFMRSLQPVLEHDGPKLLVTDSQVYRETVEGLLEGSLRMLPSLGPVDLSAAG